MKPFYACNSPEHVLSRRQFLGGAAGLGLLGFAGLVDPAAATQLRRRERRVLVVWLSGGVSQLETWDPKPGTNTGGPFDSIATSVPGVRISELLPYTARHLHRLALVRSLNTAEDEHGRGYYIMHTGRRTTPGEQFPHLGSVAAKLLGREDDPLPGYIHITPRGDGTNRQDAAFLGPRFASVALPDGNAPANALRPQGLSEQADRLRDQLRARLNSRFGQGRRTADTE